MAALANLKELHTLHAICTPEAKIEIEKQLLRQIIFIAHNNQNFLDKVGSVFHGGPDGCGVELKRYYVSWKTGEIEGRDDGGHEAESVASSPSTLKATSPRGEAVDADEKDLDVPMLYLDAHVEEKSVKLDEDQSNKDALKQKSLQRIIGECLAQPDPDSTRSPQVPQDQLPGAANKIQRAPQLPTCVWCGDPPSNARMTPCSHIYCFECFESQYEHAVVASKRGIDCRKCGVYIEWDDMLESEEDDDNASNADSINGSGDSKANLTDCSDSGATTQLPELEQAKHGSQSSFPSLVALKASESAPCNSSHTEDTSASSPWPVDADGNPLPPTTNWCMGSPGWSSEAATFRDAPFPCPIGYTPKFSAYVPTSPASHPGSPVAVASPKSPSYVPKSPTYAPASPSTPMSPLYDMSPKSPESPPGSPTYHLTSSYLGASPKSPRSPPLGPTPAVQSTSSIQPLVPEAKATTWPVLQKGSLRAAQLAVAAKLAAKRKLAADLEAEERAMKKVRLNQSAEEASKPMGQSYDDDDELFEDFESRSSDGANGEDANARICANSGEVTKTVNPFRNDIKEVSHLQLSEDCEDRGVRKSPRALALDDSDEERPTMQGHRVIDPDDDGFFDVPGGRPPLPMRSAVPRASREGNQVYAYLGPDIGNVPYDELFEDFETREKDAFQVDAYFEFNS